MRKIVLEHEDIVRVHVFENEDDYKNFYTYNYCDYLNEDTEDKERWNRLIKLNGQLTFNW